MKLTITALLTLSFIIGCGAKQATTRIIEKKPQVQKVAVKPIKHAVPQSTLPPAPKKKHIPKVVEDTNYSDKYMYPEDSKAAKKDPIEVNTAPKETHKSTSHGMSREECIGMISQEKFDKYTAMFGNEEASIKRCAMLKAMKK